MRAREHTDVDRHQTRSAQTFDRAVLQDAKQFHLHAQRHVIDIVEKNRAPLGHFEPSRTILDCPGEGAPFMAEELRLDERFREQRTADRDKRTMLATTRLVNQPWRRLPSLCRSLR